MALRFSFHLSQDAPHQIEHATLFEKALIEDGNSVIYGKHNIPSDTDVFITWSYKQPNLFNYAEKMGKKFIIMERGFIQPRTEWCSLAVGGMNGRGRFKPAPDNGERWDTNFSHHLKPWRDDSKGEYVLVIGQVPNDPSLHGLNMDRWLRKTIDILLAQGEKVVYRPHPWLVSKYKQGLMDMYIHHKVDVDMDKPLYEALEGAKYCVTYSSNTAVESVLYGVPTVALDIGSVAHKVCSHELLRGSLIKPDRTEWCHNTAWKQWRREELADGTAWNHIKSLIVP